MNEFLTERTEFTEKYNGERKDFTDFFTASAEFEDFGTLVSIQFYDEMSDIVCDLDAGLAQPILDQNYCLTNRVSFVLDGTECADSEAFFKQFDNEDTIDDLKLICNDLPFFDRDSACEYFDKYVNKNLRDLESQTIEHWLKEKFNVKFSFKKYNIFSACHAPNISLSLYASECGQRVIMSLDSDYNVVDEGQMIEAFKHFNSEKEFKEFVEKATNNWQGQWAQDCGLVYKIRHAF